MEEEGSKFQSDRNIYHFINLDRSIKKSAHAIKRAKLSNIWPPIVRSIVSGSKAEVACARRRRVRKTLHPWHQWHRNIGIEPIVHSLHEHDTFHTLASMARALPTPPLPNSKENFHPFALVSLKKKLIINFKLVSFKEKSESYLSVEK